MKRVIVSIWLCVAAVYAFSQENAKYLAGAVPEKEGKVYFSKEIKAGHLSKEEIYKVVSDWCNIKFAQADGFRRQVLPIDSVQKTMLVAAGDDYLVFQSKLLSLDRAHILYNFTANCTDGSCEVAIFRITYRYKTASSDEPERYTAEEMISDATAIKKGKLVKGAAKFRIKTIDYVDSIYAEIEGLLGREMLKKMNK